jgi:membrane-associated protease RseP (regulator of RpoE activity)
MPMGLRFCRNCGCRLGEGLAEYTETVRFQNGTGIPGVNVATAASPNYQTASELGGGPVAANAAGQLKVRRHRRMSGLTWMFLGLIIFFGVAGGATQLARHSGLNTRIVKGVVAPARSYVGVNQLETVAGGVTFDNVEPPGSPADKAGLVGGDIITTFDGQNITGDEQMIDILRKTPIGQTVAVVFIRDGETKTTKMTTMSEADSDRLNSDFRSRHEGHGRFGYETDDAERVEVPGTKLHGVRLGKLSQSLPADMAGVKDGDIVIEFGDGDVQVPMRTPEEFESRVRRAVPYSTIKVVVMRGNERLEIPVKMGRQ